MCADLAAQLPALLGFGAISVTLPVVLDVGWLQVDEVPCQAGVPVTGIVQLSECSDISYSLAVPVHETPVAGSQEHLQVAVPGLSPSFPSATLVG